MSVAFVPQVKGRPSPSPVQIQKMLDENSQLIQGIVDYQNKGKAAECLQYQQLLHRNLVYLASIADAVPSLIPPPPSQIPGNNVQPSPTTEQSSVPSPSSQGVIQQTHSTSQVNSPSGGARGNVSAVPSGGVIQGSTMAPHTSYTMNSQSSQPQQSTGSHIQTPSSQPQLTQNSTLNNQSNAGSYTKAPTPQQYGSMQTGNQPFPSAPYQANQNQSTHQYGNTTISQGNFSPQNSPSNFSNDGSPYQPPASQPQSFSSSATTQPQQQPPPPPTTSQQQQPHVSQTQDYAASTVSQTTAYSASQNLTSTTSQAYTTQSSQTYVTQTQSYGPSNTGSSQWYQASNSQQCSGAASQSNYPAAGSQGYTGPVNHSVNFPNQSASQPGGYSSPPSTAPAQAGYVHHSPSSTPQESPPPPTPVAQSRFPSNFSGYAHYRPSSMPASHSVVGNAMGPPSNNVHRSPVPSNAPQGQNYNYEQSQNYPSYQTQQ